MFRPFGPGNKGFRSFSEMNRDKEKFMRNLRKNKQVSHNEAVHHWYLENMGRELYEKHSTMMGIRPLALEDEPSAKAGKGKK